nr:MAG TPA: hypothetical protein [Caudoviricetes sp.]
MCLRHSTRSIRLIRRTDAKQMQVQCLHSFTRCKLFVLKHRLNTV